MNKLPNEIIRQIRKFESHPVADLIKPLITPAELHQT